MSRYTSKHEGPEIDSAIDRANGYGLGAKTGKLITDGNDALVGGWFYWGNIDTNLPFTYGHMRVDPRLSSSNGQILMQTAYSDSYPGCVAQRKLVDSVWKPWEWVNPPMVAGVEYRTTERFEGKPVYCQLVYFTNVVDGGTVTVNVPNVGVVLRFFGTRSGVPLPFISEKGLSNAWTNYFSVNRFTDKITITMNAGASVPSGNRFFCALYYTKNA